MTENLEFSWTKEAEDQLRACIAEGMSASQIALLIGRVTRNAVIGKAHRLGLKIGAGKRAGVSAKTSDPKPRSRKVKAKPAPKPVAPPPAPPVQMAAEAPLPKANEPLPESRLCTLLDLKMFGECKWPLGDPRAPEFRYCGADTLDATHVYCSGHRRLAYAPRQTKNTQFVHPSVMARANAMKVVS